MIETCRFPLFNLPGERRLALLLGEISVFRPVAAARLRAIAIALFLSAFWMLGASYPSFASGPAMQANGERPMTAADVEAFLDGLVPLQIEQADIAGVVVTIVRDGRVLFAKGYGFADASARTPVSPEQTLFRTGSVTKLFTWTAVMQLVEAGKLDLDADVNAYLDFNIPQPHGVAVTLRHLMTHRGGFQETLKNLGAQRKGAVDLASYVRNNIPDQIYKPGTTPSYSNYGAALAGYIVERVAGMPFDTYVEERIFNPLGMTAATLRTPLPSTFADRMSKGYVTASGEPGAFEVVNGYPAGSQSATGLAMSRFMMAVLNKGELEGKRILKAETVAQMLDTVTAYDPRQSGIGLGFYESTRNGLRILGHGGDTVYFHSDLHLVPEKKLGFFVSYNSTGNVAVPPRAALWSKFLDRYFPFETKRQPNATTPAPGLTAMDVAGRYVSSRRAETSLLRFLAILQQPTVVAQPDGAVLVDSFVGLNGRPRVYHPVGDGVFEEKHAQGRLVFVKGEDGIIRLLTGSAGITIFERAGPGLDAGLLMMGLGFSVLVVVGNLVGMGVSFLARRHYGVELGWPVGELLLHGSAALASLTVLAFVGGVAGVMLVTLGASPWLLDSSIDAPLQMLQQIGNVAAASMFIVAGNVVNSWLSPERGLLGRLKETLVLAGLLWLLWFAWTMNFFDPALKA